MAAKSSIPSGTDTAEVVSREAASPPSPPPAVPPPLPKSAKPTGSGRLRIRAKDREPEPFWREIFTPASVRGWTLSLTVHTLALLVLALIILKPPPKPPSPIDTRLAGAEQGSDLGELLQGGLGIDIPLAMPETLTQSPDLSPSLTSSDLSTVSPTIAASSPSDPSRSGGQEGAALTGSGQAGKGDGFGVARFGRGGERINDVVVQVGNPQFTLIWDRRVDLDLHVIEPGGSHLYWQNRQGKQGGQLDVDNVEGFGPENIFWGEEIDQGNGPPGEYQWYVHYYGAIGGVSVPTRWKVRVKHNGQYQIHEGRFARIGQRSKIYTLTIEGETEDDPPSDGKAVARDVKPLSDEELAARRDELFATPERSSPDRDLRGWFSVEPPGAGFRARLPESPAIQRLGVRSPSLGDLNLHLFTVDRGLGGYIITYADLPPETLKDGPDALLGNEAQAATSELVGNDASLQEDQAIQLNGYPGRAFSFDVPDRIVAGGGSARVHVFLAGERLYTVNVIGQQEFVDKPDTDRFLDGFEIIESQ